MQAEAAVQAGFFFDRQVEPNFTELRKSALRWYGDQPWIDRFVAIICATWRKLTEEENARKHRKELR